jgi:hypothetical protein
VILAKCAVRAGRFWSLVGAIGLRAVIGRGTIRGTNRGELKDIQEQEAAISTGL